MEACSKSDFQNRWMSAATWAEIVCRHYNLGEDIAFDGNKLVHAISRNKALNSLIEGNDGVINDHISVFRNKYRLKGMSKQVYCFYATKKGKKPEGVDASSKWHTNISLAEDLLKKKITRNTTLKFESNTINETINLKKLEGNTLGKRKRPQNKGYVSEPALKEATVSVLDPSSTIEVSSLTIAPNLCPFTSFWMSPEAIALFKPVDDESVLQAIDNQLELLEEANKSEFGYIGLVENIKEINLKDASGYQVLVIRQKCMFLSVALTLAKENMNQWTWKKCCEESVIMLNKAGVKQAKHFQTVTEWYRQFRVKRKFTMMIAKKNLPPFLDQNPDITTKIKQYCKENLGELSVEFLFEYLHNTIIPKMVHDTFEKQREGLGEEQYQEKVRLLLKPYRLTSISFSTASRWLHLLGFRYELRRKGYYVDGHEKPATIAYRKAFCERYLMYESRMHRWAQVSEEVAKKLEEEGDIAVGSGYYYTDTVTKEKMVEFHVDASDKLLLLGNIDGDFGGNLSVRFPPGCKPLVSFGHDESIYKQFLILLKTWIGPDGEKNIAPKDDGLGVMISAFQSREFGFGVVVSEEQLKEVNEK